MLTWDPDVFFSPKSIALVGASDAPNTMGTVITENMLTNKRRGLFNGDFYLVNLKHDRIHGVKVYRTVSSIPANVETIIVLVPAEAVIGVLENAATVGVKGAVVISSGFREVGRADLEDRMLRIARSGGIRIIGPNCLGVYDACTGVDTLFLPEVRQLASGREVVATPRPRPGSISLMTQSGAFGSSALDYMAGHGMGVRRFVSYGNRCDLSEHDFIDAFGADEKTKVILLYAEGLADGRKFLEAAREVSRVKPIVTLKSGRTPSGARAAASHTASLAGVDSIYDAAFKQAGIVRASNLEEYFDFARVLRLQPPATGNNIAVLTNAGGPGVIATDACEQSGLRVSEFSPFVAEGVQRLREKGEIVKIAVGNNPLDLSAHATVDIYVKLLRLLTNDDTINGVLLVVMHHAPAIIDDVAEGVAVIARECTKPVVAVDIGGTEMAEEIRSRFEKNGIPAFSTPERAARALYALVTYGKFLKRIEAEGIDAVPAALSPERE